MSRGTDPSVGFLGLFLMLLAWLLGLAVRSRQKAFTAMGERLARRLRGSFAPGTWPVLSFPIMGRAAILYWGRYADESRTSTLVSVDLRIQKGRCPVCGSEMRDRPVACLRCRTPHHEECWRYTGECSTFACRERRYTR